MKTTFVLLVILMKSMASVANDDGCCKEAIEKFETKMQYVIAEFKASCPPASSCKELYDKDPSLESGVYTLLFGQQEVPVYCHMGNFGCGNGGWTPVMKIDGQKATFVFSSSFWSNEEAFNLTGGRTGFDKAETKLPSYWMTSFSKICLGMMIDCQINFVVIDKQASSLYSLIADGNYRATSLGRNTWKSLIGSSASLQYNCNKEGFNAVPTTSRRVRIGFVANNEDNCNTCDSFIGFGSVMADLTCGNYASHDPDNGERNTKAMGYILVQ